MLAALEACGFGGAVFGVFSVGRGRGGWALLACFLLVPPSRQRYRYKCKAVRFEDETICGLRQWPTCALKPFLLGVLHKINFACFVFLPVYGHVATSGQQFRPSVSLAAAIKKQTKNSFYR